MPQPPSQPPSKSRPRPGRFQSSLLRVAWLAVAAAAVGAATPAVAQVGTALVAVPWQPGQSLGVTSYAIGLDTDTTGDFFGPGADLTLARVVTFGRYRPDPDNPRGLSVGWLYDHTELNTNDPRLPDRLETTALAVGGPLGRYDGWDVGFTVGGGFSGDLPYADGDAWYGVGSLFARKQLGETPTFITWFLDYDGSRSFLPDVPLPAVQYTVRESATLTYSLGLPFSSVSWQPDDRWSIDVKFLLPIAGTAEVSYRATDRWSAYFMYETSTRAYHLSGDDDRRRLFFEQSRTELGTRFKLTPEVTLTAAAGYAFQQQFSRGFDTRNLSFVRDVDDAPFLRVGVTAGF